MNQSEFISLIREKEPEFSLGLDDEALWRVMQSRYDNLKNEPYQAPINIPEKNQPKLDDEVDYDSHSPSTVSSLTNSIIEVAEGFSLPEKMLGKGVGGSLFKSISDAAGISPEFWEYAYTHSLSGMAHATYNGKQKYDIQEYAENADWKTDVGAFFAGIFQPLDMLAFGASAGVGGLARGAVSNSLAKGGIGSLGKYIVKKRGLTHGLMGGAESMGNLGTFSAIGAILAESSRQAVEEEDINIGKVFLKGAKGFLEGAAIGAISGGITKGTLGAKYGSSLIKGGDKTFGDKVTRIIGHPLTGQVGMEAALFTSVPTVIGMEGAPAFGTGEFTGEFLKNTFIIGGMRGFTALTSRGKSFGRDAEEIITQAVKKAEVDITKNNVTLDAVLKSLEDVGVDVQKIPSLGNALSNARIKDVEASELTSLKKGLKKFREVQEKLEDGTIPKDAKDRTKAQNKEVADAFNTGIFLDQVLRGTFENWRANESQFFEALTEMNKGKKPTKFEFDVSKKELEATLNAMNQRASEINDIAINPSKKVISDPKSFAKKYPGLAKVGFEFAGRTAKIKPEVKKVEKPIVAGEVAKELKTISEKIEGLGREKVLEDTPEYKKQLIKSTETLSLAGKDIQNRSQSQKRFMKKWDAKEGMVKPIISMSPEVTKTSFINWGLSEHGKRKSPATADGYIVNTAGFIKSINDKKIPIHKIEPGELTEYFYINKIKQKDNTTIQGIRHYIKFLNDNNYIKGNKYRELDDVMAGFTSIYNEYVASGKNPPRKGIREKALEIGKTLSKEKGNESFEISAELGSKYGLRREEIRALNKEYSKDNKIIKQTDKGDYYIDLPVIKAKTFAREIWIALDLAKRLTSYLKTGKQLTTDIIGRRMKEFSDNKTPFLDLRRRISKLGNDVLTGDEYRALNYMLGHDKTRIEKIYVLNTVEESITKQKAIHNKIGIKKPTDAKLETSKPKKSVKDMTEIEQLEFSKANLKKELKKARAAYKENPSFGTQGRINEIQSSLKGIGFQLSAAKKKTPTAVDKAFQRLQDSGSFGDKKFFRQDTPNYTKAQKFQDATLVGAKVINEGFKTFRNFSKEMIKRIGDSVKPILSKLYKKAKDYIVEYLKNPKIGLGIEVVGDKAKTPKSKFTLSNKESIVKNVESQFKNLFGDYKLGVAEKKELINTIAEMSGIITSKEKFSFKEGVDKQGFDPISLKTFSDALSSIDIGRVQNKKDIAQWFKTYRTADAERLRANVGETMQKELLQLLGVKNGYIYAASKEQLDAYLGTIRTLEYKKRTPESWIADNIMIDYLPNDIVKLFSKSGEMSKLSMPVHVVMERMGLKNLSLKLKNHSAKENNHLGNFVVFEASAKKITGMVKWNKYKDFLYLFDWARYNERKVNNTLTSAQKKFFESATNKEWRETGKVGKYTFSDTKEGDLGRLYHDYTKYYPTMIKSIIEMKLNPAEFEAWKKKNNISWVKKNVYVSRILTEEFKKLYNPDNVNLKKAVDKSSIDIATKMAKDKYKSKYDTSDKAQKRKYIDEFIEDAQNIAWAEMHDMMNYAPGKLSSRFLKKRHIKLPEEMEIDGKKVQVYETTYEGTQVRYATGMSKFMATLEDFPEFTKIPGLKFPGEKANIEKLKGVSKENAQWVKEQLDIQLGIGEHSYKLKKPLKIARAFAAGLAKVGLSSFTSGVKNFLLGSTQSLSAFKVRDFIGGFGEAMTSPSARMSVKRTGATELGMRVWEEVRTFKWLDVPFKMGGMKISENLNRYISVLAGRRDQARMVRVIQSHSESSRKYKQAEKRLKGFYFLSNPEISMLKKYGFSNGDGVKFKNVFESASEKRQLKNIYDKMDNYAHVNTQGSSANIFMPYWASKEYAKPLTLYKRMAYAASVNTMRNVKNAYETGNLNKLIMFGFGTYLSGEALMLIHDKLLGTSPPKENEDAWTQLTITLWKGEFLGLLSEYLNPYVMTGEQDMSSSLYPTIATNLALLHQNISDFAGDKVTYKQALDNVFRRSVGVYGAYRKVKERRNNPYNKQMIRFKKLARDFELSKEGLDKPVQNREFLNTTRTKYYKQLKDAWNLGTKEDFKKVYWVVYMAIANDFYRSNLAIGGDMDKAFKQAHTEMKKQIKYLNPNKYSILKKDKDQIAKGLLFEKWLGKEKAKELAKIEIQYHHKKRWWDNQGFMESVKKYNLEDMYKEYNWKVK